eukprot:CAMPEP_0170250162 /NCGR_PEP_ID=MMETSP0116_2-20130129/24894_1 /TAXON_ID=400756 /ORGANISM="Durinskia baltica, Strain CSIRO CS-38" /LENGTH=79 /DNA_ID=CAMNT_0010501091 /DNA_START=90 /DNA_END=325 /DNA_ORIENTATION=+
MAPAHPAGDARGSGRYPKLSRWTHAPRLRRGARGEDRGRSAEYARQNLDRRCRLHTAFRFDCGLRGRPVRPSSRTPMSP